MRGLEIERQTHRTDYYLLNLQILLLPRLFRRM